MSLPNTSAPLPATPHEVAFVLDSLADWPNLTSAIRPGVEVLVLDAQGDALAQMATYLTQLPPGSVAAIHLLSDGSNCSLALGTNTLTAANLPQHITTLARIGHSLAPRGEVLLYACEFGRGTVGEHLVQALAFIMARRVVASSNITSGQVGVEALFKIDSF